MVFLRLVKITLFSFMENLSRTQEQGHPYPLRKRKIKYGDLHHGRLEKCIFYAPIKSPGIII